MQRHARDLFSAHAKWVFVMASRENLAAVLEKLAAAPEGGRAATRVLAVLIRKMRKNGVVPLTPMQIKAELGVHHAQVYRGLEVLADAGAVIIEREGDKPSRLRVNARLATMLGRAERAAAQAHEPPIAA